MVSDPRRRAALCRPRRTQRGRGDVQQSDMPGTEIKFEPLARAGASPHRYRRARDCAHMFLAMISGAGLLQLLVHGMSWWAHRPAPHRLVIRGRDIFIPGRAKPVRLHSVNMMFKHGTAGMDHLTRQDRELETLLPGVSLVRLIMNHWNDDVTTRDGGDCYDGTAPDYLLPACVVMFDEIVKWATTQLGSWVSDPASWAAIHPDITPADPKDITLTHPIAQSACSIVEQRRRAAAPAWCT